MANRKKEDVQTFNSQMLILARESRSMNQATLAETLGISQSLLSKVELGVSTCDRELLDKLCEVLDYPHSFFTQPRRQIGFPISVHGLPRKRAVIRKAELSRLHALMNIFTYNIEDLTNSINIRPKYPLPSMPIDEYDSATSVAQLARRAMLVADGPILNLVSIIEGAGVIIIKKNFGTEKVDGISLLIDGVPPLIFIRDDMPGDRERLTLAHELGHLIMHYTGAHSPDIESEAFEFAAEFLMPKDEIRPDLRNLSLSKLAALKTKWRVAMQALLMRAKHLKTIDESRYKSLMVQMSALGYRKNEPVQVESNPPKLLEHLIQTYFERLKYTEEELASALKLSVKHFESLYLSKDQWSHPNLTVVPTKPKAILRTEPGIITSISPSF